MTIYEEVIESLAKIVNTVEDALAEYIDALEPYQRYENLHPKKKPRGSIRRMKKERKWKALGMNRK